MGWPVPLYKSAALPLCYPCGSEQLWLWHYRRHALASAQAAMIVHTREWSVEDRDGWLYGLIVGRHPEQLPLIARRHSWGDAMVAMLKNLRRLLFDSIATPPGGDPHPA